MTRFTFQQGEARSSGRRRPDEVPIVITRRRFLSAAATTTALGAAGALPRLARAAAPAALTVTTRSLDVGGRAATVFGILRPDGGQGLRAVAGEDFRVRLTNALDQPSLVHWHGLTPPWRQDGVPGVTQDPLPPAAGADYDFPLARPGTNWMHSHLGLQEQRLLAAPLIIADPAEAGLDEQEVVLMLHDFSFRDPAEIMAGLRGGQGHGMAGMPGAGGMQGMDHSGHDMGSMAVPKPMPGMQHDMSGMAPGMEMPGMAMDLNDVEYDAYLANDRTLADPELVRVERGGRVRLRVINGAAATNFHIDLGAAEGTLVAVDGMPVVPVTGRRFPIAIAQRLDIRLTVPAGKALPVLALREGERQRTGLVLAAAGAKVTRIAGQGDSKAPALDFAFEARLKAAAPLAARPADRTIPVVLAGDMARYVWTLNGKVHGQDTPLAVRQGERVAIEMTNPSMMAHPMHLHGHHFQVTAIDGKPLSGALRDTVLVPPGKTVTVAFDADNPGRWAFHCHHLYHMEGGMMTTVEYEGIG
ncbi:MAG: multicopper oxidase family protein [Inquilinus limosus]|uniref:Multicopper oxidase family protein n=1 Tax=Inquilinus limosus TaxID=171674 RepID=A0A952KDW1_9PROT|nr:multicopper oxidase family protein [Inquilinus limosus]